MNVVFYPDEPRPQRWVQPVLALGNFDGVHRGHRKILDRVRRVATERGVTPLVMTFDPHPPRVVRPDKAPPLLMTTPQRLEAMPNRALGDNIQVAAHRQQQGGMGEQLDVPGQPAGGFARALGDDSALALRRKQGQQPVGLAEVAAPDDHGLGSVYSVSHNPEGVSG